MNIIHIAHISESGLIQTCTEHCRNTAQLAKKALANIEFGSTAELAGLLHDCGKFSDAFDRYIQDAVAGKGRKGSVIHSFSGLYLLLKKYHTCDGTIRYEDITAEIIATAIASHHGLIDVVDAINQSGFLHRLTVQPEYEEEAIRHFFRECASREEIERLLQSATKEVTGFYKTLMERSTQTTGTELSFYTGLLVRLITSAVVDGDRTDTADFMSGFTLPKATAADINIWTSLSKRITSAVDSFSQESMIAKARRAFSDACADFADKPERIYRLDLPTGGGKTISSFRYAICHAEKYNKSRIFYIAPLLTILEQNAKVIRSLVQDDSLILEHHSDVMNEGAPQEDISRYELFSETWNVPIVITSMVQFLNTLFSSKMSSVRRFHAFCNSVIIIDEVQSIPREDISLFNLAINFLNKVCHATVVLCSATQPCFEATNRYQMLADPAPMIPITLLDRYKDLFDRTRIGFQGRVTLSEMPQIVQKALEDIGSLLIVCNTKQEASDLYHALENIANTELFFLSAGLCKAHRKEVLNRLFTALRSGEKLICVSTQVIEAGVDISFQGVIRILAGLDSIVQSAGRCNRNGEYDGKMPVSVYDIADEKLGNLRSIKDAQYAVRDLIYSYNSEPAQFNNSLASDQSVNYYYRQLFRQLEKTRGLMEHPLPEQPTLLELLSENESYAAETEHADQYYLRQAFRTAGSQYTVFDEDTVSVVVPYGNGMHIIENILSNGSFQTASHLLQSAKDYIVTIHSNMASKMLRSGALRSAWDGYIYILSPLYYDPKTGIQSEPRKELMECNILIS